MDKLKLSRNLWILAGVCFFISIILDIGNDKSIPLLLLQVVTCILCFVNAFMKHDKINKNNKS